MSKTKRTWRWWLKCAFASYAAAFATMMLLGVIALPFAEYRVLLAMFQPIGGLAILFLCFLWGPVMARYLK